jgi:hypothetical protein
MSHSHSDSHTGTSPFIEHMNDLADSGTFDMVMGETDKDGNLLSIAALAQVARTGLEENLVGDPPGPDSSFHTGDDDLPKVLSNAQSNFTRLFDYGVSQGYYEQDWVDEIETVVDEMLFAAREGNFNKVEDKTERIVMMANEQADGDLTDTDDVTDSESGGPTPNPDTPEQLESKFRKRELAINASVAHGNRDAAAEYAAENLVMILRNPDLFSRAFAGLPSPPNPLNDFIVEVNQVFDEYGMRGVEWAVDDLDPDKNPDWRDGAEDMLKTILRQTPASVTAGYRPTCTKIDGNEPRAVEQFIRENSMSIAGVSQSGNPTSGTVLCVVQEIKAREITGHLGDTLERMGKGQELPRR